MLSGFTLNNGATRREAGDLYKEQSGGGVWCASRESVVTNCIIAGNSAYWDGGGAYGGTFCNCIFSNNASVYWSGGGVSGGLLNDCTLTANYSHDGGSTYIATLNNCRVEGNSAYSVAAVAEKHTQRICLTNNRAYYDGGGAYQKRADQPGTAKQSNRRRRRRRCQVADRCT